MFGPNPSARLDQLVAGHHREPAFMDLVEELPRTFRRRFGLGGEWDVLFLTGSGTLGLESAIWSLRQGLRPPAPRGKFTRALADLLAVHGRSDPVALGRAEVALETDRSEPASADALGAEGLVLLDAVSSFPYYPVPKGAGIWVTVSSKQLGGPPVVAIVAIRADMWEGLADASSFSSLNLARHRGFAARGQTPHTPAMPLLADLAARLERFDVEDLRARIDRNSAVLAQAFGKGSLVGSSRCPVVTVPKMAVPPLVAKHFELYGLRTPSPYYHVFTYSEPERRYQELADAVQEARGDGVPPDGLASSAFARATPAT